jgi:opacity protein-like surface antigen
MKKLILLLLVIFTKNIFSQNTNISATISYPITLADTDFNRYTGIADIGIEYLFYEDSSLEIGTSFNTSYFVQKTNFTNPSFTLNENIFLFQPNFFLSFKMSQEKDVKPFLSIGYVLATYDLDFNVANGPPDERESKGGLNIGGGVRIEISEQLFVLGKFDYVGFNDKEDGINLKFSNNFSAAKLGLGYRF